MIMNQDTVAFTLNVSFFEFLFKNKKNKIILLVSAITLIIQFSMFKYLYPFASFIHGDSFSYLDAAHKNLDINTYMIGYSKFLRIFSVFTKSDTFLVAFQYFLIQSSLLFLLFTIFYFYRLYITTQYLLLGFMVLNPLFLHIGNLVSSDCLFISLSIIWFALLLWILFRPSLRIILFHSIVILLAFTVRYNALIYPFISAVAFCLSPLRFRIKILGTSAGIMLCALFVFYTSYKYKILTGYWQYSPFSGWQLTNNAMYAYRYVSKENRKPVPKRFQVFDNMVREYFDSTRDTKRFPYEALKANTVYMWSPGLTMFKYRNSLYKKDSNALELKKWASMGPFYRSYGIQIISQYPITFIKEFIWPNALKYYAPSVEFLEFYNSGKAHVSKQAQEWFGYKSRYIKSRFKTSKVWILDFYPIISGIANIVFVFIIIFYFYLRGWKYNVFLKKAILLSGAIWLLNAAFTIGASSAALRFQTFPILITIIFTSILLDWLWTVAMESSFSKIHASDNADNKLLITQ